MVRLRIQRHLMPALSLATWLTAALASGADAPVLTLGVALFILFWLIEWTGIEGDFAGAVPRNPIVMISRVVWLGALAFSVFDAGRLHVSTLSGWPVRAIGAVVFLAGLALRLWCMRMLRGSFSYDLKVAEGQDLVTRGPYRSVRHPAYTGLVLLSVSCGVWNPSGIGFLALVLTTLPQVIYRIEIEERLLADHFGECWKAYARGTRRLVPWVW